jgi:hypothetical protein
VPVAGSCPRFLIAEGTEETPQKIAEERFAPLLIPSVNLPTSEEQASGVGQKALIAVFKIKVTHS